MSREHPFEGIPPELEGHALVPVVADRYIALAEKGELTQEAAHSLMRRLGSPELADLFDAELRARDWTCPPQPTPDWLDPSKH